MADDNKNMNPGGLPPDSDLLLAYLKREMSNAEKHELEKRMLADDFMADAAEGLSAVNNPAVLTTLAADVNAKFGAGSGAGAAKLRRSPLAVVTNTLAVAASVALLIVAGYFISQNIGKNKTADMAMAKKEAPAEKHEELSSADVAEPAAVAADSVVAVEDNLQQQTKVVKPSYEQSLMKYRAPVVVAEESVEEAPLAADYKATEATGMVESKNQLTAPNTAVSTGSTANWDLSMYGPASNSNNNYSYTPISAAKTKKGKVRTDAKADTIADQWGNRAAVAKDEDVPGYYIDGTLLRKEKEVGETDAEDKKTPAKTESVTVSQQVNGAATAPAAPQNKSLSKGLDKYTRGDYKGAIADLEDALKKEPNNYKAQYSLAMAYKNTNKPDRAIERFSAIQPASPYYENALWEKANLYLEKDKDDLAVATLKTIIKQNGTYKVQAQKMLKKLQEQNPGLK